MSHIFFDTEFSGLTQQANLLSIALVPDQGPWFYAVCSDVDTATLSPWHQQNVVSRLPLTEQQLELLPPGKYLVADTNTVTIALRDYLAAFDEVIMWADVPAYDWVLFCQLFGGALQLPKNIHYIVRDLATLLEVKGYDIDTDRFALAYGKEVGAHAGAIIRPSDGRVGQEPVPANITEGLLRHNALGDAMACRACWEKLNKP